MDDNTPVTSEDNSVVWGYWADPDTKTIFRKVPKQPLRNAQLKPPCTVTRPDGLVIEVVELPKDVADAVSGIHTLFVAG